MKTPDGSSPELSLLGDGIWSAAVALWSYPLGLDLQRLSHSRLNSERFQAMIASMLKILQYVDSRIHKIDRGRLLSQALEAEVGEIAMSFGTQMAIDFVIKQIEGLGHEAVVEYLLDLYGDGIPGGAWNFSSADSVNGRTVLRAQKGAAVGWGMSKVDAQQNAILTFYFTRAR